jgi:hypothetical protein
MMKARRGPPESANVHVFASIRRPESRAGVSLDRDRERRDALVARATHGDRRVSRGPRASEARLDGEIVSRGRGRASRVSRRCQRPAQQESADEATAARIPRYVRVTTLALRADTRIANRRRR